MLKLKSFVFTTLVAATWASMAPPKAEAGPLYDWLWRHQYKKLMCCAPKSFAAPVAQTACQQPNVCSTTCSQTCQRVVVNYVPYTAYRCDWEQVPVTQYQQTCSTDPCTGCTVTCQKPCTTYTWQQKRVPYTTYRPVYRTESYTVPITYAAMAPSPCNTCSSCQTCPTAVAPQTGCSTCGPNYANPVVSGMPTILPQATLSPAGTYTVAPTNVEMSPYYQQTPATSPNMTPADQVPTIGNGVLIDRREITPQGSSFQAPLLNPSNTNTGLQGVRPIRDPNPGLRWDNQAPGQAPITNIEDQTASAPTHRRWEYSPVRLASHLQLVAAPQATTQPQVYRGSLQVDSPQPRVEKVNSAWTNLN